MKIPPEGADLIHEDRLGEFTKSSKNMQRGLYDNCFLNTIKIPVIGERSETLPYMVLCLKVLSFH
jgi:hypothetical protein